MSAMVIPIDVLERRHEDWTYVATLEEIPVLGARVVKSAHGNIAVFRNAEDEVFALRDQCPHKGGPLSQGIVYGRHVSCPLHNWSIGLEDGVAVKPDEGCTGRFPAKLEDGKVFLKL
jgi:nitrite reductase (NADH) small subunit